MPGRRLYFQSAMPQESAKPANDNSSPIQNLSPQRRRREMQKPRATPWVRVRKALQAPKARNGDSVAKWSAFRGFSARDACRLAAGPMAQAITSRAVGAGRLSFDTASKSPGYFQSSADADCILSTFKALTSQRTPKSLPISTGLLPHHRIPPQEMLSDLCAGKDFGAEGVDFVHGWVDVVLFMCGPGGAGFASGEKAVVVNQS